MEQPSSALDKSININNNTLDSLHHELQGNQAADLFPFPGFTVNNQNDADDHTPITKISCGPVPNCANSVKSTELSSSTATTKTPPAEPSVSPEIQSNLSRSVLVSGATPSTCYGAGHIISGVVDKRKCKSRGILSAGHKIPLEQDISDDNIHLIPCPVEASISWRMSPSYADDDEDSVVIGKGNHLKELNQSWKIVESPSSLCTPPFPSDTPNRKHVISREERPLSFEFNGECSPFSADTIGSENVMQTPNSDTSLERRASFESEFDQVTNVLQQESLSPNKNSSPWDPPRLSLDLADVSVSSPSNITIPNQLREKSDIYASWISNSTSENVSESNMRISWRDGLVSGSFDKDDFDCCRLLSDEEMDTDRLLKSPRLTGHEIKTGENGKTTSFPNAPNPCTESVCTDDGGPIASRDSDWTRYYKN
ncbi:uncharacterized protein [Rutidosis leptorrhynchoides]|uniref:uncharacterized protein n=1 Tax=Rutidosis leptorrhynchoides TaxID=125765 RepID=UPI003A997E61